MHFVLPDDVRLPSPDDFNTEAITLGEVFKIAHESSGWKVTGLDRVPVEVLHNPLVAGRMVEIMMITKTMITLYQSIY